MFTECLKENKKILKKQHAHNVYTEEINKIALSFNGDKRLIADNGVTTYSYGIGAEIFCKQELLSKLSRKC